MKYPWIDGYLKEKRGVTADLQPDWNWHRYHLGGKMFAAVCMDEGDRPVYITLKTEPAAGEFWRGQYEDIIPGYYMNKLHWISVKADGCVPGEVVRELLDRAWRTGLRSLSGPKQREALGLSVCGADCDACPLHPGECAGCNEARGKVFHMPEGEACPIYACCVKKHRYAACASCGQLPCALWRTVRDPALTEEQFEKSIADRTDALRF